MGFEPPIWILHYPLKDLSVDDLRYRVYKMPSSFKTTWCSFTHWWTSLQPVKKYACMSWTTWRRRRRTSSFLRTHENYIKAQERLRRGSSQRTGRSSNPKTFRLQGVSWKWWKQKTAFAANVTSKECPTGICEVAKYWNGCTDRESLPANAFKWGGEFLLYIFSLIVIFIDTRK